jgi:Ca-activated chloride channel family protein
MRTFLPLSALAVSAVLAGGAPSAQEQEPSPPFTAESDLVVLHVTVRSRAGSYVDALGAEAFHVFEENRPQRLDFFATEDSPITVGLIIDSSGSMGPVRDRVLAASIEFVESSNRQDEVFALVFNDDVKPVLAASDPFTENAEILRDALSAAFVPAGRTALHDAIAHGLKYAAMGSRQRHALIVLSDGGDNASATTFDAVLRQTQASNVVIYTVAIADPIGKDANPKHLRELAITSGGIAFEPRDVESVRRALQEVSRDIRHAYTIGYEPTDPTEQVQFHPIRVEVRSPSGERLPTRTRKGYLSGRSRDKADAR